MNSKNRAALTQIAIEHVNNAGARVISLTGDGLIANIAMTKDLGADFDKDQPYFPSPTNPEEKIYVIWDPPHMLKLARGCLKSHQLYHETIPMHWNYIESLHDMQKKHNFNLGNKLTQMHVDFHVRPPLFGWLPLDSFSGIFKTREQTKISTNQYIKIVTHL